MLRAIEPLFLPAALMTFALLGCLLLLFCRKDRLGRAALVALLLGWYALSTEPVPRLIIGSLERHVAAAPSVDPTVVEAIVVLAGAASYGDGDAELNGAMWRRLWRGLEVYWQLDKRIPIILSGGGQPDDPTAAGPAALAAAVRWGVPAERFWLENESPNTRASGSAVKEMLDRRFPENRRHRVVLVTSAWHMPRALRVFRRLDMDPLPVPCDFFSTAPVGLRSFLPSYEAFNMSSIGIREGLALLAYRLGVRG